MTPEYGKIGTKNIVETTLVIQGSWGYDSVIIYPHATVNGSFKGNGLFLNVESDTIDIVAGGTPVVIESDKGLDNITITAPVGCTLVAVFSSGEFER
jgi:hypothetical protein